MRITTARIKTYRTVKDEISLDLKDGLTLVGPNNVGKTNILKAIRTFFTGLITGLVIKLKRIEASGKIPL